LDLTTFELPKGIHPRLRVRRATADEWDWMAGNPDYEITTYEYQDSCRILAEGDQLMVGEIDGRIVSFHFVRLNQYEPTGGGTIDLPEDTVYAFRGMVPRDLRRQGLASTAMAHITDIMKREGYRLLVFEVEYDNVAQRRAVAKIGSVPLGIYLNFGFLFREKSWIPRRLFEAISHPPVTPLTGPDRVSPDATGSDHRRPPARESWPVRSSIARGTGRLPPGHSKWSPDG
jgi:GNAT superfamily N-acetyltransferase